MARGKTVYIKSESGRVENFDQFRAKLRNLSTPEKMRFKELRSLLMKEAQPLVAKARQEAYKGSVSNAKGGKKQRGGGGEFYNLYNSISKWPNKGDVKAYVVVGLRGKNKKGAYYAPMQLFGADKSRRVGVGRGQSKQDSYTKNGQEIVPSYTLKAKSFFDKAVNATDVPAKAQKRITKFVQKRIKEALR